MEKKKQDIMITYIQSSLVFLCVTDWWKCSRMKNMPES